MERGCGYSSSPRLPPPPPFFIPLQIIHIICNTTHLFALSPSEFCIVYTPCSVKGCKSVG